MLLFFGKNFFYKEENSSSKFLDSASLFKFICHKDEDYIFCKFVKILVNQSRGKLSGYYSESSKDRVIDFCRQLYNFFISNAPSEKSCVEIKNFCSDKDKCDLEIDYTSINILSYDGRFLFKAIENVLFSRGIKCWLSLDFVLRVKRSASGNVIDISEDFDVSDTDEYNDESLIYFEAKKVIKENYALEIKEEIEKTSEFVSLCALEFHKTSSEITSAINEIKQDIGYDKLKELINSSLDNEFYLDRMKSWLLGEHFIAIGSASYALTNGLHYEIQSLSDALNFFIKKDIQNQFDKEKNSFFSGFFDCIGFGIIPVYSIDSIKFLYHIDIYIGEKKERLQRFYGLLLKEARSKDLCSMPIINEKISEIILSLGYKQMSFGYMKIKSILQSLPIEFFLIMNDEEIVECIEKFNALDVSDSSFIIKKFENNPFILSLSVTGGEFYEQNNMLCVEKFLSEEINCKKIFFYSKVNDYGFIFSSTLFITSADQNILTKEKIEELQKNCSRLLSSWEEKLLTHVSKIISKRESRIEISRFCFPRGYKNDFDCKKAYADMMIIEEMQKNQTSLDVALEKKGKELVLYTYSFEQKLELSEVVPVIENMSFKIVDHKANDIFYNDVRLWIQQYDIRLRFDEGESFTFEDNVIELCRETIRDVICGALNNSVFNKLVSLSGINSRQVFLIVAMTAYLKQIGNKYSQEYISECLVKHNKITFLFVALFDAKFSPKKQSAELEEKIIEKIEGALSLIENIAEDLILSSFFELIRFGIVRTNFYQNTCSENKCYLSFKVIPSNIESIPLPKPYAEIFVYSGVFEGIHLRGGKVARGGIRWSDRKEDYRMEVLGLMKAQMTKNSIIVPVGAKGGFVVKDEGAIENRDLVIESYKNFIRGLLDLTDNIVCGEVKRVDDIVSLDEPDHYLVVAADKGTATFSDFANAVSDEYKFWLGDAFASGGSSGYDHKDIGITARGAWVCAVNHLKKIGIDAEKESFSVIGIGDMSGDVFGNGMLLSKTIKLLAAFNHSHIFIDPDPIPEESWKERKRLFGLKGSKWTDYQILSNGGAVYSRSMKKIELTKQVMDLLHLQQKTITPSNLIRAILCMKVDLIWNGGIGTYVKSELESNDSISDKTNDDVRVNGNMLNAKIVVEGGNLGFTQLGRIEYANAGGLIHTDFIDNCGGVNCSDREVNIKIALNSAVQSGKIDLQERNKIMLEMTEDVANKVLHDSVAQTEALSVAITHCEKRMSEYCRFLTKIEEIGIIDSKIEFVPSEKERKQMMNECKSFSSPILSVLIAYSKIWVFKELINTNISLEKYFEKFLINYFPKKMREAFIDEIENHVLKNDILANVIANDIVNTMGITFVSNMVDTLSAKVCDIVRAYFVVKEIFEVFPAADNSFDDKVFKSNYENLMFEESRLLFNRCCRWLIKNFGTVSDIIAIVDRLKPQICELSNNIENVLMPKKYDEYKSNVEKFLADGLSYERATKSLLLSYLSNSLSIIKVSEDSSFNIITVAKIFALVEDELSIDYIEQSIKSLESSSYRRMFTINSIVEEFKDCCVNIVENLLLQDFDEELDAEKIFAIWKEKQSICLEIYKKFLSELTLNDELELEGFIILLQKLKTFR